MGVSTRAKLFNNCIIAFRAAMNTCQFLPGAQVHSVPLCV